LPEIRLHRDGTKACGAVPKEYHLDTAGGTAGSCLPSVKRVLLTGMSGTGKSSIVRELVSRGYKVATHEVRTTAPLNDVAAAILRLVDV